MEEKVQRLLEHQTAVNKLALALSETGDLEQVYRTIYESIRVLMDANAFIVSFYDHRSQLIYAGYVVTCGVVRDATSFPPIPLEPEERGTQSRVIRTKQPLYVPDWRRAMEQTETEFKIADKDGSVTGGAPPSEAQEDSTNSAVLVPMQARGEIAGVMQVQSRRLNAYTPEDIDLLAALANVAAIAIYRARVEKALREREELYRTLVETSPDAIALTDLDGHILAANQQLATMHGFDSLQEMQTDGWTVYDLIAGAERQPVAHAFEAGAAHGAQYTALRKDGITFPVEISLAPVLDQDGNPTGFIAVQRDITARQRLEAQLRQAQKMQAIGRLAGGIAHDFNNLLTAIGGYADLSLRRLSFDGPMDQSTRQEIRSDLEDIQQVVDRAAALTNQFLIFSRKHTPQPRVLDLNHLVQNIEKMLRRLIGEDIELCAILGPKLDRVRVDPGHIEQVIVNLAVNARDAMPRGGKLTLETANVVLDEDYAQRHLSARSAHCVMLAASDTGSGMTEEVKAHLFEPFFTTKAEGKGTGLGLATVYGIIDQCGGRIEVYSELGVGTTFKIYLPQVKAAAEQIEQHHSRQALPSGTETVLLVEDDESVQELAYRSLKRQGYTVLVAHHPDEAMLASARHCGPIHLLLTDMVMPGMGGRELAEWMTSSRPETGVLYMSGYTDDAIVRHGVLEPDVAFLQKPFTPSVLALKVREVLDGSPKAKATPSVRGPTP